MKQINEIILPIKCDLDNFEIELKKIINNSQNFLMQDLENFLFKNPKRLRPIFVFLFSKILEIDSENVLKIALATEIIHNASLLHDDVIDEEEYRRNTETFYKKFGSKIAILEGDFLLSLALEILSKTNNQITLIFAKRIKDTILGEIEQNINTNKIIDEEIYYRKTFNKTGSLFLAGLEALFALKEIDNKIKESLINFIKQYALAFQIKNDIDNFLSNKSDIKNGNYTLPVLYLCKANANINIDDLSNIKIDEFLKLSQEKIGEIRNKALNYIDSIEESIYKKTIIELCELTLRS